MCREVVMMPAKALHVAARGKRDNGSKLVSAAATHCLKKLIRIPAGANIVKYWAREGEVGAHRGGTMSLKASDAAVKDSKDDQNRTSTRSCRSNPDQ